MNRPHQQDQTNKDAAESKQEYFQGIIPLFHNSKLTQPDVDSNIN